MSEFLRLSGISLIILAIAFCLNGFTIVKITHVHSENKNKSEV